MPALLTKTSIRPNRATAVSTSSSHWFQSPTWHRTAKAWRPRARDLVGHLLARLQLPAGDDDVCTGFGKPQRHGPAQALAGTGDDNDLPGRAQAGDGHRPAPPGLVPPQSAAAHSAAASPAMPSITYRTWRSNRMSISAW